MNQTLLGIGIADIKPQIEKAEPVIEARLKAAMLAMRDHWAITTEDDRFRCAVGGVMDFYGKDSEEWNRLKWEMEALAKLSAFLSAAQSGLSVDAPDLSNDYKPIGLMKLWKEIYA